MNILNVINVFYKLAEEANKEENRKLLRKTLFSMEDEFDLTRHIKFRNYFDRSSLSFDPIGFVNGKAEDGKFPINVYVKNLFYDYRKHMDYTPDYICDWYVSIFCKLLKENLKSNDLPMPFLNLYTQPTESFRDNKQMMQGIAVDAHTKLYHNISVMRDIFERISDNVDRDYVTVAGNKDNYSVIEYSRVPESMRAGDRTTTTLGRYIRRNLKLSPDIIPDKILNIIVTHFSTQIFLSKHFDEAITELTGEDIEEFYKNADVKIHSCMTGTKSSNVELFSLNSGKVKLITYKDVARALLWKCDDGSYVLDRVYPSGSQYVSLIRGWAESKGIILRDDPDSLIEGDTELSDGSRKFVTLKHKGTFPYMDTFKFGDIDEGSIDKGTITFTNYNRKAEYIFTDTGGSYKATEYAGNACANCEEIVREGEGVEYDNRLYCQDCFYQFGFFCEECNEPHNSDDGSSFRDNYYCQRCWIENFTTCNNCSEEITKQDAIDTEDNGSYCDDCKDKLFECVECDKFYTKRRSQADYIPSDPALLEKEDEDDIDKGLCDDCVKYTTIKGVQKYHLCSVCNTYFDYRLINNKCKNCMPGLYSGQLTLPIIPEHKEINKEIIETIDKSKS